MIPELETPSSEPDTRNPKLSASPELPECERRNSTSRKPSLPKTGFRAHAMKKAP